VLKCPTLLRFHSTEHFISHDVPSSLKASFESVNRLLDFYTHALYGIEIVISRYTHYLRENMYVANRL
jgi:hypothetical protein